MNIVFIENKLRIDKLGILYLSAVLKQHGHNVELLQAQVDPIIPYFETHKVDVVCYSVMSGEQKFYTGINFDLICKGFKFKSIFGGPHFTFFPEQEQHNALINHIVIGPGELVINDIVEGKITDKIVKGTIPSLDDLPEPDRSILYKYPEFGNAGMKRFIASRDCPNACTYCFNHTYHKIFNDQKKSFFQRLSPRKMIDQILNVKKNYTLNTVYFNDDDFISDKEWLTEFLDLYKSEVNLPYCGSLRANHITDDVVKQLAESRCHFMNIALESANRDTQLMLRRGAITNDQVLTAVRLLEQNGIKVRLQNMIGLPVKNPLEDALETYEFNKLANPTDSWASILQPFHGTDMWKYCMEHKYIDEYTDCTTFYDGSQLKIPNKSEIENLHKWWYFAVKYKLPTEFLRILLTQELTPETKKKIQDYRWELTSKEIYKI